MNLPGRRKHNTPATLKARLLRVLWILGCAALFGGLYLFVTRHFGIGIPCMFNRITGLQCPGCGLTRAIVALSRLDIRSAIALNPLVFLYLAYFLWYGISLAVGYVKGKEDPFYVRPIWLHIAVLSVILVFTVIRNLPLFHG